MSKIITVIEANEFLSGQASRKTMTEIMLTNGSRILCLPNNPDRFRGFTATDVYLDEAAHFQNDELVLRVVKPMISASHGRITIISTPSGKRGFFYNQYVMAVNSKGTEPEIEAFDFFPSTINPLITKEFLLNERLNLNDLEYKQEYLGEFIETVDVYYPIDIIQPCVDPTLTQLENGEAGRRYLMGIDFAKKRDETVVIMLEETNDHEFIIRHIAAWSGMDYSQQIGRIAQLAGKFRIQRTVADKTGVGEALMEDLKRVVPSAEGVVFSLNSKADMAGRLRIIFEQKRIRIPNDKKLITQLNSLRYEVTKNGSLVFASPEREQLHDDYVWALAMACHAAKYTPLGYFTL
jgi:phage FluMu gp28-like protein